MNQQVLNVRLVNNAVLGSTEDSVGAHTVIGLLKQLYEKLRTSTGNTSINIGAMQGAIRALENIVNGSTEVEPPIVGLTTQVSNINTEINGTNGLRSQISAIESVNSAQNSEINSLKSRATSIEDTNQQQTVKINDNEDDITALTIRVSAIDDSNDGRLTVVEHSVANLVSEVEGQGGALDDIIDLQANVGTLQTNVGTLQTDVGTLQTNVGTLQTNVGTLQTDVGTLQQTVNNLPPAGVGQSTNQTGGERFNLYEANRNAASGNYSHAEGYLTNASGNYTHTEGSSTSASAESAHAEGSSTQATGRFSHAEGYGSRTSNAFSHAEGYYTLASGENSHAEGYRSQATGLGSHAEGGAYNDSTTYGARASYTHVEGYSCLANNTNAHAEGGYCNAAGHSSHAEGYNTTALGKYSHAANENTYADTQALTAVGKFNTYQNGLATVNRRMFVVGNGTDSSHKSDAFVVNFDGSVIINSTRSETNPSLIIGNNNSATGKSSLAQGEDTYALGNYSLATGLGTFASSNCLTAIGKYNTTDPMGDIISRLFVVGNGNNDNDRSDAFTVYNSGEFGHNDVKMFMGDITLNVYYANSNHDITTFAVAYMTSNYKYCYIPNITIYVRFQGAFNINSIVVNGKTFKALDPSKNRGGGFATAGAHYQLDTYLYPCTLSWSGSTYYYLHYWVDNRQSATYFENAYWNISFNNCIFQDPAQYDDDTYI